MKQLTEIIAMLLIGDGFATMLEPRRHCLLWEIGPKPLRETVDELVEHPGLARAAGLVELLIGILLARRQKVGLKAGLHSLQ